MNFLIFRDFFWIFSDFFELIIDFSNLKSIFQFINSAEVTWRNLERPIDRD